MDGPLSSGDFSRPCRYFHLPLSALGRIHRGSPQGEHIASSSPLCLPPRALCTPWQCQGHHCHLANRCHHRSAGVELVVQSWQHDQVGSAQVQVLVAAEPAASTSSGAAPGKHLGGGGSVAPGQVEQPREQIFAAVLLRLLLVAGALLGAAGARLLEEVELAGRQEPFALVAAEVVEHQGPFVLVAVEVELLVPCAPVAAVGEVRREPFASVAVAFAPCCSKSAAAAVLVEGLAQIAAVLVEELV